MVYYVGLDKGKYKAAYHAYIMMMMSALREGKLKWDNNEGEISGDRGSNVEFSVRMTYKGKTATFL